MVILINSIYKIVIEKESQLKEIKYFPEKVWKLPFGFRWKRREYWLTPYTDSPYNRTLAVYNPDELFNSEFLNDCTYYNKDIKTVIEKAHIEIYYDESKYPLGIYFETYDDVLLFLKEITKIISENYTENEYLFLDLNKVAEDLHISYKINKVNYGRQ